MKDREKIIEGLERAFVKLIEFKKYKKTPFIFMKDGKIVEVDPEDVEPVKHQYK